MNFNELHKYLKENKLPAFREKQIYGAYFGALADSWEAVTVLPKDLREKLEKEIPWDSLKPERIAKNKEENCFKAGLKLEDGRQVESVLIRHADKRNTVCVSSQVGCPLGCAFCATGQSGFKRNLEAHEIVEQIIFFARWLKNLDKGRDGQDSEEGSEGAMHGKDRKNQEREEAKVTNIVFMGMGEPMLNYDNVISAIKILNDKNGFGLGARHISISTIGIPEGIRKLAKENLQVNLAFSLHAPNDKLRSNLCPINKRFSIKRVIEAIDEYIEKTNRKVMVEYVMLKGVNDNEENARELAELLKGRKLYYVNLILYNKTLDFEPSPKEKVEKFKALLEKARIQVTIRKEFGREIWAACGMLKQK